MSQDPIIYIPDETESDSFSEKELKEQVRKKCANYFNEKCEVAKGIVEHPDSTNATKIRALDLLGRYGGLLKIEPLSPLRHARNIAQDLPKWLLNQIENYRKSRVNK
jgi:hypothetical protein